MSVSALGCSGGRRREVSGYRQPFRDKPTITQALKTKPGPKFSRQIILHLQRTVRSARDPEAPVAGNMRRRFLEIWRPPPAGVTDDHHLFFGLAMRLKMPLIKKLSSSRKHNLKSCMLAVAKDLLEAEASAKGDEREVYLAEKCPPLELPYSKDELLELCKKLHEQIHLGEEEKYGIEFKLNLVLNEVRDLNIKIVDLRGKFKRPKLKKVRMSADAMLKALLGSKHTVNMDLRSSLKQVKKEVKEEDKQLRDVGDWRKNIEDKSDRKKMFDS
ncbi:troponin I, fast skeletal muscle-like [Diretmus argenteus]